METRLAVVRILGLATGWPLDCLESDRGAAGRLPAKGAAIFCSGPPTESMPKTSRQHAQASRGELVRAASEVCEWANAIVVIHLVCAIEYILKRPRAW